MRTILLTLALTFGWSQVAAAEEARLLRFPTIHKDQIVFSYAGNLYTVPAKGGVARRLTSHPGYEMFARFSPDGKQLAFTGQYDGNTEVFLMPAEGGKPKRLTYTATLKRDDVSDRMGPNNIVIGWTPDGKNILFRSRMKEHNDFIGQLFLVSAKGGLPKQLPLPRGGFASYSPTGDKLAYNRVFREFRTWKKYRGGMADDIWVYDFKTKKTVNITKNKAQDIIPMWHGDKIYFLSDRDDSMRMNLYVYDTNSKEERQLTHYTEFDIKFPSLGPGGIVFEYAGYIYRFDLETEKAAKVPISIHEDDAPSRTVMHTVDKEIHAYEISPDGKRALFSARGDIFTVPAKQGPTRNLTNSPGVHDRNPKWSPDGKSIAYISDASGEDEIWVVPQDGIGPATQLTNKGDTYKYTLSWSPDSQKILWADKKLRLQYLDVKTKKVTPVAQGKSWEIREYVWSPDSNWIAFTQPEDTKMSRVWLYSLDKEKATPITSEWYDSSGPAFGSDGKYLFYVSARDFKPVYSKTEWNHAYVDMSRIYLIALAKDTPSPFKPESDEVGAKKEAKDKKDDVKKPEDVSVKVDLEDILDRTAQLKVPVAAGYGELTSVGDSLYYVRSAGGKQKLCVLDVPRQKETVLGDISGYEISADRKKMLVHQADKYAIIDVPKAPLAISDWLNLSDMEVKLDRKAEWRQIFNECWRQMRDFFYDPGLHGVDWLAVKKRYAPLVDHVNDRADLTAIIGDMIAELGAGHCYVGGGDSPKLQRLPQGLLGAQLERDEDSGFYKIAKILKGANWDKNLRSPLTEIGVNVKPGEYIIAIDGRPVNEVDNIFELLVDKADKQVRLKINAESKKEGGREVTIVPIADEHGLYYFNWVEGNRKKVTEATGGKVGYLHIPDMQAAGLNEFVKHYYPQLKKKALIIDVRGNGGGNVSPQIIERLTRKLAMMKIIRNTEPYPDPFAGFYGPKVCLINEFSASDGDLFPYRFKKTKLGKLIGKRTWGGVIGIRGSLPLLDGGYLMKPEFATYAADGQDWIIENYGVDPDIVVDNDPAQEYAGTDQQLNRAIEQALTELQQGEWKLPGPPPYPKR
jgi:tricorn protease